MHSMLGGLACDVYQRREGTPERAVVLCHGYGAPGDDLVGLAEALVELNPALARTRFVFPQGVLALDFIAGDARAWWPIDLDALMRVRDQGPEAIRAFRQTEPPGMAAARAALKRLVDELSRSAGLDLGQIYLGGFSQGSMLATDVALGLEEAPAGLVVLSGTLLTEATWRGRATRRAGLRVFQSHGRQDQVLDFGSAQALAALFTDAGMRLELTVFEGGHTIPLEVLKKLAAFLK